MPMNDDPALVGNAADPAQVHRARRKEKDRRTQELADLQRVLAEPAGRRVLWRVLDRCGLFRHIWAEEAARMYLRAGEQNIGHWLMAEIEQADDEALFRLMVEARQRAKREAVENAAAQTARAT
jgi:hypothetical protein